jgi:DNA polymerase-1
MLPGAEMLAKSQLRGIHVSPTNMLEVIEVFEPQFEQAQRDLKEIAIKAGFDTLNPNSPQQLMAMFKSEGYTIPNTRKATLQEILDTDTENPFVNTLLKYRTLHKLIRNYLLDVQRHVKNDQRVHPHAFLIGTTTGRLTYKDPAMQTLPKPKTVRELGIIRKIFSATNDDYILLEADYAQIEAWLGAFFSKDPLLLADLQSSDWHSQVATSMFNVTKETVDSQTWAFYRDAAKHINYGSMYGEEAQGLTRRPPIGIGCDLQTAKNYLRLWREHYIVFTQYQDWCKKQATDVGFIQTPFGRKRRFPLIVNDHQLRQAVNYQLQSTAGDYTLSSAIRLEKPLRNLDTHLLFIEHDALYYEVNKAHYDEAVHLIKSMMELPPLPELPSIRVEVEVGQNLADLEKIHVE